MSNAEIDAARLLLRNLGIRPEDLLTATATNPPPTFGEYIPRLEKLVTAGTLRTYRPYWQRIQTQWPDRRINEPTTTELQQLVEDARRQALVRRNSRDGRSAGEHMAGAIRSLYRHARNDGYIHPSTNPADTVDSPRRAPSPRTSLSHRQLQQIVHTVETTGNDPELDSLILRLHLETACRRSGALALRPIDLDYDDCLIWLREKDQSDRWQPVSPTLMHALAEHSKRSQHPEQQLLRYHDGRPITDRRYDHIWDRVGKHLPWAATLQITAHWLRHTTLTWVERHCGYAVARAYAGHREPTRSDGPTLTYVRASLPEVAAALALLTGEPHPLADTQPTPYPAHRQRS
ncbi:tyrosine-type recombinase/integrase [Nocardia sp. SYP-A9097]|uniref:tyrosine-type recombinase/integrase n=1 Tax=Nocardia sp. SYP-A9097 TaxID=2663237 RepID=UPI00129AFF3C|nr:tyrosine-type recombinase/integrase [Nocardia sp. SYP-A9097]MRH92130.1 tyrosine-type recombinase/integrase [Nocardia sp. SYP-A9097]